MTHDDTTLQAAIDAALQTNGDEHAGSLVTLKSSVYWPSESLARLAVAKAFLAALPPAEQPAPDERSLGQVAFEAFGYTHIWDAAMRKGDWQRAAQAVVEAVRGKQVAEIEKLEAELAQIKKHLVEANRGAQQNAHVNQSLAAKLNEALKSVEKAEFERGICEDNAMKLQADLARIVAAANEAGWNGVENPKDLAEFIKEQSKTLEQWSSHIHPDDHDRIVKGVQDRAKKAITEARQALVLIADRVGNIAYDPEAPLAFAEAVASHIEDLRQDINHAQAVALADQRRQDAQPWTPTVGDTVRLKSGGQHVTVKALTSDGLASCIWFDLNGQYHQLPVPVATLELVRKEKP